MLIALGVHLLKSAARPVINATTAGFGAPVASTAEDATSVVMSVVAILLPVLVLVFLVGLVVFLFWFLRRRRGRRAARLDLPGEAYACRDGAGRHPGQTGVGRRSCDLLRCLRRRSAQRSNRSATERPAHRAEPPCRCPAR